MISKPTVLTTDIEHINTEALANIEAKVKMYPRPATVERIKDKYRQKLVFHANSLPTPAFRSVDSVEKLKAVIEDWGGSYPVFLKTRCNAYDGRGNFAVHKDTSLEDAVRALCPGLPGDKVTSVPSDKLYVEQWVPYAIEVSVMVAKSRNGTFAHFPLVESLHVDSILRVTTTPTRLPDELVQRAKILARRAVSALTDPSDDAGIFGVEMFIRQDTGEILLNEVAPRPHNSGHYTLSGTTVSQFEMHLRAVLGLPISDSPLNVGACVMLNILGQGTSPDSVAKVRELMSTSFAPSPANTSARATVYFYQKYPWNEKRKIGHINVTGDSAEQCYEEILSWPNANEMIGLPATDSSASSSHPLIEWRHKTQQLIDTIIASLKKAEAAPHPDLAPTASSSSTPAAKMGPPLVGVIMGSDSDLPKMKAACEMLEKLNVPFEVSIVSAHRTPDRLVEYAKTASKRGLHVIIAGAGGAAHLPGMVASMTSVPVIGVPILIEPLLGLDSTLSILQMPAGIPVATVAINNSTNAALLAVRILSTTFAHYRDAMVSYQQGLETTVLKKAERLESLGWREYKPM